MFSHRRTEFTGLHRHSLRAHRFRNVHELSVWTHMVSFPRRDDIFSVRLSNLKLLWNIKLFSSCNNVVFNIFLLIREICKPKMLFTHLHFSSYKAKQIVYWTLWTFHLQLLNRPINTSLLQSLRKIIF